MATKKTARYSWSFFRAGEVDQVVLAAGEDLAHLHELDQKLWLALACPTKGLEFPTRTLNFIDTDGDGRVRVPELLAAVRFCKEIFRDLGELFKGEPILPLESLREDTQQGKELLAGAKRILENLGKADAKSVALEDVADTARIFAATRFNGDGVVPADAASDPVTRAAIEDILKTHGQVPDRSGKPGVDQPRVDQFFQDATAYADWLAKGEGPTSPRKLGDKTDAAEQAMRAVRAKLDDFFTRCRLAAYDGRAAALLNASEAEFLRMGPKDLSAAETGVAKLPLSRIEAGRSLPLSHGLNPAWEAAMATFVKDAVTPLLGAGRMVLSEAEWLTMKASLAPFVDYLAAKPETKVEVLGAARVRELLAGNAAKTIADLIAQDAALATESNQIDRVEMAVLYRRDLVRLLRNFVNFSEFYGEGVGIFQTGTLFLDRRGCELCLPVEDAGRHVMLAGLAKAYLAYCDLVRKDGAKRGIVAVFTGGDTDHLMVGRNGVFYDRQGNDWDATITKIVENPISIRQAFFAPYKNFVRMLENQVAKRASAADAEARSKVEAAAVGTAMADKTKAEPPKPEAKKMDVGTVAAIGVAVGGFATFLTALVGHVAGLKPYYFPIVFLGLILAISGPSMLIAWLKLRQRNLGPILDANGWAVNALAKINIPFGGSLTKVGSVPLRARRRLKDPFAVKRPRYGLYVFFLLLALLAGVWGSGRLDSHLPEHLRAEKVLQRGS